MNLFARPLLDLPPANTRRVFWIFLSLFLIGLILRGTACATTISIVHPDEHQQFIEQAYRMIHGYGRTFWEQDQGIRHPLYPALLAAPLRALDATGVRNPAVQLAIIRFVFAALTLWSWCFFAWQFQRRGDSFTAVALAFIFALSPDLAFIHTHLLSEVTAVVPFLLGVCWLDRRPILAGMLLGISFGIRFQMGFLIAGLMIIAWIGNRFRLRGAFLKLVLASLASLIVLGIIDWLILGFPFKSPVRYFYFNIWLGHSKNWGEHPWYQYFKWLWEGGGLVVIVLAALLLAGAIREWKLTALAALFFLAHIAVAHKEGRFLLPIAPFALALIVVAMRDLLSCLPERFRPAANAIALIAVCAIFIGRFADVPWENDDGYRSTSLLLHDAGQRPDLTGVGVLGIHPVQYGNYFFLQRDVPLYPAYVADEPYFPGDPDLSDRRINYLITPPKFIEHFARWQPEPIVSRGRWTLYRLDRSRW